MEPLSIVVISSTSVVILGQLGYRIYKKYFQKNKMTLLATYDPNMEMGPII